MRWRLLNSKRARGLSRKEILAKYVLLNPYIWLLSRIYVLSVRGARGDQRLGQPVYVSRTLGVVGHSQHGGYRCLSWGDLSALVAGWGSDRLFSGNRGPMNLIFAAGIFALCGFAVADAVRQRYVMQAACFFRFLCLPGPQDALHWHSGGGVLSRIKRAAGAATGFVGLFAYLGASAHGWPLAKVLEIWHYGPVLRSSPSRRFTALLLLRISQNAVRPRARPAA